MKKMNKKKEYVCYIPEWKVIIKDAKSKREAFDMACEIRDDHLNTDPLLGEILVKELRKY